jgi:hypothetical protein
MGLGKKWEAGVVLKKGQEGEARKPGYVARTAGILGFRAKGTW